MLYANACENEKYYYTSIKLKVRKCVIETPCMK